MQALRQQVLRRDKSKMRFKFQLACLAGNNIAICPNSTEFAKELSRRSLSLMKKAREEKQMRKRALSEIGRRSSTKKLNFWSVGVDPVDATEEPSLERAGLSYGGFWWQWYWGIFAERSLCIRRYEKKWSLFFPSFEDVVQPSVNSVFSQRLHAEARRAIGRFFLYSDINKLVCCSEQSILPAHVYAVAVCGAGFKGPSYNEMRTTIRVEEKEDLEKAKELSTIIKSWKDTGCTIICDGWTNKRGRPFIHFFFYLPSRYDVCEGGRCYIRSEGCNSSYWIIVFFCDGGRRAKRVGQHLYPRRREWVEVPISISLATRLRLRGYLKLVSWETAQDQDVCTKVLCVRGHCNEWRSLREMASRRSVVVSEGVIPGSRSISCSKSGVGSGGTA